MGIYTDFENGYTIDACLSTALVGKAPERFDWAAFYRTFERRTLTPRELAVHVWRGFSFTPVWHTARREENFVTAYHLAFDFDAGDESSSLDSLMRDGTFAWMFASFGYTTPSHTEEKPRSRLVFVLDFPIDDPAEYRRVYRAVAWYLEQDGSYTDPACKDALRLYYGSPRCRVWPNWSVLGKASIEVALAEYEAAHPVAGKKLKTFVGPVVPSAGMKNGKLRQMGEKVRSAPLNEGHNMLLKMARLAGGYVASNSLDEADVIAELTHAAMSRPNPDEKEIDRVIRDGLNNGKATPVHFEQARPVTEMF